MSHLEILARYGIHAKKSLGQNFLVNDEILERIADTLDISGRNVVEIGPGYGALTERILARHPSSLTLVELDPKMVNILEDRQKRDELRIDGTRFEIVHGDVLKYVPDFDRLTPAPSPSKETGVNIAPLRRGEERSEGGLIYTNGSQLPPRPADTPLIRGTGGRGQGADYVVIANIPYYITSPILFRFLHELEHKPSEMLILMQKEVADKICRKKGNKNSYLSLAMEYACDEIEEVLTVSKTHFIPPPKIESSVLRFKRRADFDADGAREFLRITSAGFSAPRKKLLSNLAGGLGMSKDTLLETFKKLAWSETIRAEEVDLEGWRKLYVHICQKQS